ncbi:MAG: hypothetical protein IPK83_11020 [Planctomycetes bacterium]|nr:hypothetical protein [Planctomycetota bacterium]
MFRKEQAAKHGGMARKLSAALRRVADDMVVAPRVQAVWSDWNMVLFEGLGDGISIERLSSFDLCRPAADVLARLHSISIRGPCTVWSIG